MSNVPELERLQFYPGQLLTADDLTTLDSNNRRLRWLHNRSLHNWGIGSGFDVTGKRGDTSVTVHPGYAIDDLGREIILADDIEQPIPAVSGPATYYLVAEYLGDSGQTTEEQRDATACYPGGSVRLTNDPAILWKTKAQLKTGTDVILAEVSIQNCVLSAEPLDGAPPLCDMRAIALHEGRRGARRKHPVEGLDSKRRERRLQGRHRYFTGEVPDHARLSGAHHRQPHARQPVDDGGGFRQHS